LDDVAIHRSDGRVEPSQVKSVLSDRNPISNRAPDLWKTFYNWLLAVKENELIIDKTIFKIFVAAERDGSIVASFNSAVSSEEALSAWRRARSEFYDGKNKEKTFSDDIALYIRTLFSSENMTCVCGIIQRFILTTIEDKYTEVLYNLFCQKTIIPEDLYETTFTYMLGWVDKQVAEKIEAKKAMVINFNDYRAQTVAITRELNQRQSLIEIAPLPSEEEVKNEYSSLRVYLKQLNIINCNYTEKIEAINDYIRASTNRVIWAKRGDISEKSFISYQESLIKQWGTKKEIINIRDRNLSPDERGKLLFLECKGSTLSINHLTVPSFFTPGCYHALSDELTIGWHPTYKQVLCGDGNDE